MSVAINGGTSTPNVANVDAGNNLAVTLPTDDAFVGKAIIVGENDPGTITGAPYLTSPEVSDDFRLRVGIDTILFDRTFNFAAQDTGEELYRNTTMTFLWGSGFLTTNGGSITTTTTGGSYQSQRSFPLFAAAPLYIEATIAFTSNPVANTVIDFGLGTLATTNPFAPTDGAYFRMNSVGVIGVGNFNGAEQTLDLNFVPVINQNYRYVITLTDREIEFWIDDVLHGTLERGVANGTMMGSGSGNFIFRHAITGGAAGGILQAKMSSWAVHLGDLNTVKTWSHQAATGGRMAYQGIAGGVMGSTANYANNANPTPAAGSNTAALVVGLGGQAAMNAPAAAVTDLIFTSYQVPLGAVATQTPRNLVITGVKLSTINMGAVVATTPTTIAWSLAFGHTAVSLATAEAATTKAPRRVPLGMQYIPVGGVIGQPYTPDTLVDDFDKSPIVVHPGEFVAVVGKILVGTATAGQQIWVHAAIFGYME
jgi:hypothetical protein